MVSIIADLELFCIEKEIALRVTTISIKGEFYTKDLFRAELISAGCKKMECEGGYGITIYVFTVMVDLISFNQLIELTNVL